MDAERTVTEYYRSIDAGEYEALAAVIAPEFVHRRPDRTIEGRTAFVGFMREERPRTDTTHDVDTWFVAGDGEGTEVAVAGRLCDANGEPLFEFVDRHEVTAGAIRTITTYTR